MGSLVRRGTDCFFWVYSKVGASEIRGYLIGVLARGTYYFGVYVKGFPYDRKLPNVFSVEGLCLSEGATDLGFQIATPGFCSPHPKP